MVSMFRRYAIIVGFLFVPLLLSYILIPFLHRTRCLSPVSTSTAIRILSMARTPVYFLSHGGPNIVSPSVIEK